MSGKEEQFEPKYVGDEESMAWVREKLETMRRHERNAFLEIYDFCKRSERCRLMLVEEGWDRLYREDPIDALVEKIRFCVAYDYMIRCLYLNHYQKEAVKGFIDVLDTNDLESIMEALMRSCQNTDCLQEAYDDLNEMGLLKDIPYEDYRKAAVPMVRIFTNMLGDELKKGEATDKLSYRRCLKTPIGNCLLVAEYGDVMDDVVAIGMTEEHIDRYMTDFSYIVRKTMNQISGSHPSAESYVIVDDIVGIQRKVR